jgi:hypothetical protein
VFNPSWSARALDLVLQDTRWGWDQPTLPWGEFLGQSREPDNGDVIWLRIASTNLPTVPVVRRSDTVQYSRSRGEPRDAGVRQRLCRGGSQLRISRRWPLRFYANFEDTYDGIAVIPQSTFFTSYGAFHRNVQNAVRGIGLSIFDISSLYGSRSGRPAQRGGLHRRPFRPP